MSPLEFHLVGALWIVSTLLSGRLLIKLGMSHYPTPIWPIGLASTGSKKSAAFKTAVDILNEATSHSLILPPDGSREGFLVKLKDRPNGFVFYDEFGGMMEKSEREYVKGLKSDLSTLFDGGRFMRSLVKEEFVIERPRVSIIAATVDDSISEWIRAGDLKQGFMARFLFVPGDSPVSYTSGLRGDHQGAGDTSHLVAWAKAEWAKPSYGIGGSLNPDVRMTDRALDAFEDYDRKACAELVDPHLDGMRQRLGLYALKLATAYCYAEGREVMEVEDVDHATAFLDYCRSRVWPRIESNPGLTIEGKILERFRQLLRRMGSGTEGGWVRCRDHQKRMHLKLGNYDSYLITLDAQEELEKRDVSYITGKKEGQARVRSEIRLIGQGR